MRIDWSEPGIHSALAAVASMALGILALAFDLLGSAALMFAAAAFNVWAVPARQGGDG